MNRILVVDDDKNNLKAIERLFIDGDDLIEFAQDGLEALNKVSDFNPDLVILDIMMPGMNGYEVCQRLKANQETAEIMILLLSGKGELEDRLRGYDYSADDFLAKPYYPEELMAKVSILLRLKKAQDELKALNKNLEIMVEMRTRELIKKERQALVGEMVQGIIHNFQGPLMVIHARAEFAAKTFDQLHSSSSMLQNSTQESVKKVSHNLNIILEAAEKLESQIKNLLSKGRQDASEDKQTFNLNELITREMEFLDADMNIKHRIIKQVHLDPSIDKIYGLYSDFSQVIYNMTKNASDAMIHSSIKEFTVLTKQDDRNIYIDFCDTGSGIAPENLEKIFEPFFTTKVNDLTSPKEPMGTGLGLNTCVQLMKNYGGEITVKSELKKGSTFTVIIPKKNILPPSE